MTVTHLAAGGIDLKNRLALDTLPQGQLPEAFHSLVEVAILASVVDPFDPMEKAFHQLGERFLADTEHLHRDWRLVQTYALSPALRAMSHVWAAAGDGAQTVADQGRAGSGDGLVPPGRCAKGPCCQRGRRTGRRGLRVLAVARGSFAGQDWPANEHDFDFEFIGCSDWPTRCAHRCRPPWPSAVQPASAW
jgi:Ca2+-transporting ATPase